MTIQPAPSSTGSFSFRKASNNGSNSLDPSVPLTTTSSTGQNIVLAPFENEGPYDQGAAFDFSFGPLAARQQKTFYMYVGAASNEEEAKRVTQSVDAEVYAFAKPSNDAGQCIDSSNVFIMAFREVGGTAIDFFPPTAAPSSAPSAQPSNIPTPYTV